MKAIRVQRDVVIFILLLLIVLVGKWKTLGLPYYWDETIWVQGAYWLSKVNLLRVIPGFHPDAIFDYHPPVLHLSAAAFFKLFGNTSSVGHLLIVLISFLGVFYTYLLGSFLHGRVAGIWLFIRQHRIWFTLLIILNFAFFKTSRWKKENLLFLLLLCSSGYSFAFLQFLPRYLLPLLPLFCILAAWSLTRLIPSVKLQYAAAFLLCFLLIISFTSGKVVGTSEWDMKYLQVIDVHKQMSAKLEKDFSESRIVTSWPLARQLNTPYLGYVQKPLKTYQVNPEKGLSKLREKDVFYWSEPPTIDGDIIKEYAAQKRFPIIGQVSNGEVNAVLYAVSVPSVRK